MSATEGTLWWYKVLHKQVVAIIQDNQKKEVLDAACGTGGLLAVLKNKGITAKGFDLSALAVQLATQKGLSAIEGELTKISSIYPDQSFDCIVCNDALYFLSSSQLKAWFEDVYSILKPRGICVINYPAFNCFSGTHDLSVGIKSRTRFTEISKMIDESQFIIKSHRYWPFLLSPLILATRLLQRLKLRFCEPKEIESDVKMPGRTLNNLFYKLTSLEIKLLPTTPFGSSLFLVLERR